MFSSGEGGGGAKGGILFFALVTAGKDPLLRGEASVIVSGEGLGACGAGSAAKLLVSSSNSRLLKSNLLGNAFKKRLEVALIRNTNASIFLTRMIWFLEILSRENLHF